MIVTLLLCLLVALLWQRVLVSVPSGSAGVLYRWFGGTELAHCYAEGLHLIAPWNTMFLYETRRQVSLHDFDVLSAPGLPVQVALAIRFQPERDRLPLLHQRIGPDYARRIVMPQTESVLRRELSGYTPEQIYTNEGGLLAAATWRAREELARNFVLADEILIRSVALPEPLKAAIEDKLTQEQLMQSYQFRLQTADAEAMRKRAEARGIRDFQAAVEATLSPLLLHHEGIRVTRELSISDNARVVILGRGEGGLPLVSGGQ